MPASCSLAGECLDALAAPARLGQLQGPPRRVGGLEESSVAIEHGRQAIERVGGLDPSSGDREHLGAAAQRRLVLGRAGQRQVIGREGLRQAAGPGEHPGQARLGHGPVGRDRGRLGVRGDGLVESPPERCRMPQAQRLLVAFVERLAHPASSSAEQLHEQRLLDVETVLGLVEDETTRSVHHRGSDLLAAVCRQAVHGHGVGPGGIEQRIVDLVAGECVASLLRLGLLAHRRPGIGVDDRRSTDDLGRIMAEDQPTARRCSQLLGPCHDPFVRRIAGRVGEPDLHPQRGADERQRVIDVVAVTDERDDPPLERSRGVPRW